MTNPTQQEKIEELLLELVSRISSIRAGKTFDPKEFIKTTTAQIQNLITEGKIELLEGLKTDLAMHTVPEGRHLLTRSYVNNAIDFEINQLKGKE